MDYFKILTILVIIILIYQIYLLNKRFSKIEGFADVPVQSLTGIDDTNAINTLAQIAKNLMAGGVTVPGAINLSNSKTKFGLFNDPDNCFRIKDDRGAQVLAINDGGSIYSKGDGFVLSGNDLTLKGTITAAGRNILAELDKLNSRWEGEKLKATGGILIANKWLLKDTGDDWLRVFNAAGTDYYGGVAAHNLWSDQEQFFSKYPKFGQNLSAHPIPDGNGDAMFDFGSSGRTGSANGWSIVKLVPR